MTEKYRSYSMMMPENLYKRLRGMSYIKNRSMTSLTIGYIEKGLDIDEKDATFDSSEHVQSAVIFSEYSKVELKALLIEKILKCRQKQMSYAATARALEGEKLPTPSGKGRWHRQTVYRLLKTEGLIRD